MNPTDRASHLSRKQVEVLIEFLEKYPNINEGFSKVPSARYTSRKAWERLTIKLNSLGGCVKTSKQWTKYWANKKRAVKKKASLRYRARNKIGGGFQSVVELSETYWPAVLGAIPPLTIEQLHETSYGNVIDVDVFTPTGEEAQTLPRIRPPSPLQPPTPSGSGQYPEDSQLDQSDVEATNSILFVMEKFLKLREQRLEFISELTTKALNGIAEAVKYLAEALNNKI